MLIIEYIRCSDSVGPHQTKALWSCSNEKVLLVYHIPPYFPHSDDVQNLKRESKYHGNEIEKNKFWYGGYYFGGPYNVRWDFWCQRKDQHLSAATGRDIT